MNIKSKQFNALVQGSPYSVAVNGDLTFALRQWKKILKDNKIIEKLSDNRAFQKKSDRIRIQNERATYNQTQKELDNN